MNLLETVKTLLAHVRHAYDCPELKEGAACTCGFHEAIAEGFKVIAELDKAK